MNPELLIDTHAHLYHDRFADDLEAVVQRAREAGVTKIILPAVDVPSVHQALELCDRFEGVYAMAALHPSDTKDATDRDFEAIVALCDDPRVVAVGESGIDYYWDRSFDAKQQDYFRRHVHLAIDKDLPLIMHLRDKQGREEAHHELVRILEEERLTNGWADRMRGIFHCYSGPDWLADQAMELGFMLGIGGTLTFKNSGVAEIVKDVPLDRIVLETDAPFLAPAPHRGKRNEPAYVRRVAEKLAEVKGIKVAEVAEVTTANARRLFGIS